jgi:hypothetical protein
LLRAGCWLLRRRAWLLRLRLPAISLCSVNMPSQSCVQLGTPSAGVTTYVSVCAARPQAQAPQPPRPPPTATLAPLPATLSQPASKHRSGDVKGFSLKRECGCDRCWVCRTTLMLPWLRSGVCCGSCGRRWSAWSCLRALPQFIDARRSGCAWTYPGTHLADAGRPPPAGTLRV